MSLMNKFRREAENRLKMNIFIGLILLFMKKVLLISLALLFVSAGKGQEYNVDSLTNALETVTMTTAERMETYRQLCYGYFNTDVVKHRTYAELGLLLAEKEKDLPMLSRFNGYLGVNFFFRNNVDSAELYLLKALDYAMEAKHKPLQGEQYNNLAIIYGVKGDKIKELEYFRKGLELEENPVDKKNYIVGLMNLSTLYRNVRSYEEAESYLEKALTLSEETGYNYGKLGSLYGLGQMYYDRGEFEKSKEYFEQSLELCLKEDNNEFGSYSAHGLGLCYMLSEDFENAEKYTLMSIELAEKFGAPGVMYGSWAILARVYLEQKLYDKAEDYGLKAWEMDVADSNMTSGLAWSLGMINMHKGDKEKAEIFFRKFRDLVDKSADENLQQTLVGLEVKYETEKKETKIAVLESERQLYLWLGLAGALLLLTLLFILWLTRRNARKEKQLIAARSVMDGEMKERFRLARDLHDRLSGNLSAVRIGLKNNTQDGEEVTVKLDACIDELRRVSHNLMPMSLHYGMKVALEDFAVQFSNVHFHFFGEEKRVEERIEFVIYCCANELVNNSIKHSGAKNINLQLIQDQKHISLTVEDDGSGFDERKEVDGIGLKNIRDRVASCNGKIDIVTSQGKGTETTIELKVKN